MEFGIAQYGAVALVIGAAAFFAGGMVKGVIGLGLPLVAVPVLASAMDPKVAVAMMTIPVLASNVWLVYRSKQLGSLMRRFGTLMLTLVVFALVGAQLLVKIDAATASLLLGIVVVIFCATQVFPVLARVPERSEAWLNPAVGTFAGVMGGISNFFGPPLMAYLIALRLPKDTFVAAMSLFFITGGIPLYGSLAYHQVLTLDVLVASAAATVIVAFGILAGAQVRKFIRQEAFEKILIGMLFLIGLNLIRRGVF